LDPDGVAPKEDERERRRGFSLAKHADGSSSPRGRWTAELTVAWETIFNSLTAPNASGELPDQRTADQRRHDALAEAGRRLLRSNSLLAAGGAPVRQRSMAGFGAWNASGCPGSEHPPISPRAARC
jgi:hypothetical protein